MPVFFSIRLSVILHTCMYTVSHKNDTDVGRYNFDVRQPILTIMSRNVTQRVRYQNNCNFISHFTELMSLHYLGKYEPRKLHSSYFICL